MTTSQMSTDQIRAWLALEGYVCWKGRSVHNTPWLQKYGVHHVACWDPAVGIYHVGSFYEAPDTVSQYPLDELTDKQLRNMARALEIGGFL